MTYKVYTSEKYWQERAQLWSSVGKVAFFSQPKIQEAWCVSHGKPALRIIEVEEAGKVVGVLPLCTFDEGKTLQFLGDQDVSDYLDWIVDEERKESAAKGLELLLKENVEWKKLILLSIPHDSSILTSLNKISENLSLTFSKEQQDIAPIIPLPNTWDGYLQQVGKKQRHEVQRKWKRLEEQATLNFRIVTDISQNSTDLHKFFTLHRASSVEKSNFWTPEHTGFFEALTTAAGEGGWLRLYFLDVNGEPAAAMYCFDYNDSLLVYNSGFNAEKFLQLGAGQVLNAFTIKDAIEIGKKKYDFLRGGEEYKMRYGAIPEPVWNVTITR